MIQDFHRPTTFEATSRETGNHVEIAEVYGQIFGVWIQNTLPYRKTKLCGRFTIVKRG
jgi:hypothetical protein